MTTTCNNGTYAMYEKKVRGFLATQFGLSVHPYGTRRSSSIFSAAGPRTSARWRSPGTTGLRRDKRFAKRGLKAPVSPLPGHESAVAPSPLAGSTGNGEC